MVRPKKQKRKISRSLVILVVLLLLALAGAAYAWHIHVHNAAKRTSTGTSAGINFGPPSPADKQAAEQQKITETSRQQDTTPTTRSVVITSLTKDAGGDVIAKTKLTGTGWQSCTLTLTAAGANAIVMMANVLYQPSFSTCEGFTVKASQFNQSGTWTAQLAVTNSDGKTGNSAPVSVKIGN